MYSTKPDRFDTFFKTFIILAIIFAIYLWLTRDDGCCQNRCYTAVGSVEYIEPYQPSEPLSCPVEETVSSVEVEEVKRFSPTRRNDVTHVNSPKTFLLSTGVMVLVGLLALGRGR